jgi:hypothetical protein
MGGNIHMRLKEGVAQNVHQWLVLVTPVMSLKIPEKAKDFKTG